jgi:putative transcriptional regulator
MEHDMAKKAFNEIMAGIQDAVAFAKGDRRRGVEHVVRVPDDVDVRAIRTRFGLSRAKFAARFGLDTRAIQDWEQGRRHPDRSTRVLLKVIEREPDAVERALAAR